MKTTTKKIVIKKKPKQGLNPAERGVLWYMLETRNQEGLFQQHYTNIATAMNSTPSTIHRYIKTLIEKGAVEIVAKSHRGHDGYPIPAVLRPIPPMESAYSTNGTGSGKMDETEKTPRKMEQVQPLEIKSLRPIPIHQKPVPNGTLEPTTVNEHRELSVESGDGDVARRTVVTVEQAPRKLTALEKARIEQKAAADKIRRAEGRL